MLSLRQLIGAPVTATDGDVGALRDAYLDVDVWVVDTLIVEPTAMERTMPLALTPDAVRGVDPGAGRIELGLSLAEVGEAPSVDLRRPPDDVAGSGGGDDDGEPAGDVGEEGRASSPFYSPSAPWGRPATIGDEVLDSPGGGPSAAGPETTEGAGAAGAPGGEETPGEAGEVRASRPHSVRGMIGDEVVATDGEIGTVDDLLADPETWHVDCLVVASEGWVAGTHASVSTAHVLRVDRSGAVHLGLASGEVDGTGTCGGAPPAR